MNRAASAMDGPAARPAPSAAIRLSLLDHCRGLRDRLLASPRFQRWAAGFPLTRRVARRHASELFDLCAGFVYSQVLQACIRLDLFNALRDGPCTRASLCAATGLADPALTRLLEAAIALRLVERRSGDRYGLGSLGAAMLGQPAVAAMVLHHAMFYDDLRDPVALLRGENTSTALSQFWAYARSASPQMLADERLADYSALMSATQSLVATEALDAYDVTRHAFLLDVGGGEGGFAVSAAERAPQLRIVVFDLPPVAARARARMAAAGLGERAHAVGGSFLTDRLPRGADLITLVRVLHDHDDAAVATLLRAAHDALPHDGVLLVVEPMAEAPGAERVGAAYFGFYLLAMGSGQPRTAERLRQLLHEAGFTDVKMQRNRTPLQTCVLTARPRRAHEC